MLDSFLNVLFPVQCILCSALVRERRCGAVCAPCWLRVVPVSPPFCPQCGFPATAIEGLCGRCRKGEHQFDFARSVLVFDGTLREIIHHFKYADRVSLAGPLGKLMRSCLQREGFTGNLVLPVPLHPRRERERGFNQAELLAKQVGLDVDTKLLRRKKNTRTQTGLSRSQRKDNLRGAFEVRQAVTGSVIVIDDVYTTGSTANEIAKVLKRAGASRVEVLTLARVCSTAKTQRTPRDEAAPFASVAPLP